MFVLLEIYRCDIGILSVEVDDYLPCVYIRVPYNSVLLGTDAHITNVAEEHIFIAFYI